MRVARAHHLADNREVASLLMSNKDRKEALEETEPTRESDAERLRKLARMNAVKTLLHEDDEKTTTILVNSVGMLCVHFSTPDWIILSF